MCRCSFFLSSNIRVFATITFEMICASLELSHRLYIQMVSKNELIINMDAFCFAVKAKNTISIVVMYNRRGYTLENTYWNNVACGNY